MIRQLRKGVFWSVLLSAAGVLFIILFSLNILNILQIKEKEKSIIDSARGVFSDKEHGKGYGKEKRGRGKNDLIRAVSTGELGLITIDDEGSIREVSGIADDIDEEILGRIVEDALADTDEQGSWKEWIYRLQNDNEILIFNTSSFRREAWETAGVSLLGFVFACSLFILIAKRLSDKITAPVEKTVQAQKRFIADASHELKTPLAVIDANASVLEKSIGKNKWLDYIKDESGRMKGLVSALLELSALDEMQQTGQYMKSMEFDASEAVTKAVLPLESVAYEKNLNLDMDLPENVTVNGNPEALSQIIKILMDNAIKNTSAEGTICVSVIRGKTGRGRSEKDLITINVANTGNEIPDEVLPHLFERFYKADESRKYSKNSYGLGLAIAKGIADRDQWSLSAKSENGWNTFSVII